MLRKVDPSSTVLSFCNKLFQFSTLNFFPWQVEHGVVILGNSAFQLAMQQCCATSWTKMFLILLGLSDRERDKWLYCCSFVDGPEGLRKYNRSDLTIGYSKEK